jgi:hypothetical protein
MTTLRQLVFFAIFIIGCTVGYIFIDSKESDMVMLLAMVLACIGVLLLAPRRKDKKMPDQHFDPLDGLSSTTSTEDADDAEAGELVNQYSAMIDFAERSRFPSVLISTHQEMEPDLWFIGLVGELKSGTDRRFVLVKLKGFGMFVIPKYATTIIDREPSSKKEVKQAWVEWAEGTNR